MASAFDLFGTLNLDTRSFENSVRAVADRLKTADNQLGSTIAESKRLGDTLPTVGRRYEKLSENIEDQRQKLLANALAFEKGEISAKKFTSVLNQVDRAASAASSRIKDANARLNEISTTGATHFQNQIKGVTSEASNLTAIFTGNRLSGATTQISAMGSALSAVPGPAGLAAGGLAIVGVAAAATGVAFADAAIKVSEGIFDLVKTSSEYTSKIKDMQDQTGLAAETLTALKLAAAKSGVDFETVGTLVAKFSKLIGSAATGNDKAAATLARFGIDGKAALTNLNGALEQAFDKLSKVPEGVERLAAAQELFGKGGYKVVGILKELGGSTEAYIESAKKLGLTLTEADIAAGDAFGDTLTELGTVASTLAAQFSTGLAPAITEAMKDIESALSGNEKAIRNLGDNTGNVLRGIIALWQDAAAAARGYQAAVSNAVGPQAASTGGSILKELALGVAEGPAYPIFKLLGADVDQLKKLGEKTQIGKGRAEGGIGQKGLYGALLDEEERKNGVKEGGSDAAKKAADALEKARENAVKIIEQQNKEETSALQNKYKLQEALLSQHLAATGASEAAGIAARSAIQTKEIDAQIDETKRYYNALAANAKDATERAQDESNKRIAISNLETQKQIDNIKNIQALQSIVSNRFGTNLQVSDLRTQAAEFQQGYKNPAGSVSDNLQRTLDALQIGVGTKRVIVGYAAGGGLGGHASELGGYAPIFRDIANTSKLSKEDLKKYDEAVISATNGLDPKDLSESQRNLAAVARTREADRLQQGVADALNGLTDAIKSGGFDVTFKDESNSVKSITKATPAATAKAY